MNFYPLIYLFNKVKFILVVLILSACSDGSGSSGGDDPATAVGFLPNDFSAVAGSERVTLTWTHYNDSSVYNIYRSTDSDCELSNYYFCDDDYLFSDKSTGFTDVNLANGTTYYYWIEVTIDGTVYTASSYVSATPEISAGGELKRPLNDTGIDWGANSFVVNNIDCTSDVEAPQDCDQGRDFDYNDDSDGHAGFSFTKLDSNGNELPADSDSWSCVQDNVTGLTWEVKTDDESEFDKDNTYRWGGLTAVNRDTIYANDEYYDDWNNLVNSANSVSLCGFRDWRVPDSEELRSIINYSVTRTTIDTDYFPNTNDEAYWSASPVTGDESAAWQFNFYGGFDLPEYRRIYNHVRLVRLDYATNSWSDSRYEVHGDGTVTDTATGLMWLQCSLGQDAEDSCSGTAETHTWPSALEASVNYSHASYSDWRLPNIKELSSLVARDQYLPVINSTIFPNTELDGYWSSSPSDYSTTFAWGLEFDDGQDLESHRDTMNYVRLVR